MEKINQLINNWPRGAVYTSVFLKENGFSRQLINRYKKSGWLEAIGTGAYIPKGTEANLLGGIYALQQQLNLPVHIGGKSALILKGRSHFVPQELKIVFLFYPPKTRIPNWFRNFNWPARIQYVSKNLFSGDLKTTYSEYASGDFAIKISCMERAALEMVEQIPDRQSFNEANLLMENLITLRPAVIQLLLENCRSIKAKRLFLFLAEKHQYIWVKKLSLQEVELGKGKRSIIKNGRLDKKYKITVPAEYE